MGSRKIARDFFLSKQLLQLHLCPQQVAKQRFPLVPANSLTANRRFSVLDEFSKKLKGEVQSNPEFQKTIKDLKEKAGELKDAKEELKERTKKTTEELYKRADGVWTDAEATAKKVSASVKDKISAAAEDVKETLGIGKQESTGSTSTNSGADSKESANSGADSKDGDGTAPGEERSQKSDPSSSNESLFERIKSSVSSASPMISSGFQKLKDVKVVEFAKKGYEIVKDELSNSPSKRRRMQSEASSSSTGPRSTNTDIVVVPVKQSHWGKKWEAFKEKMHGHPMFKRISGVSKPVVTKGQELAEDMRERWETSDHPVVHKIQDLNESVFGETSTALSFKEIRRRDPSFSLPEFVADVEEMIRPTLIALLKGDAETLKKNCSAEVIQRCLAERRAFETHGFFFDNKILHISEVEVRETKLMGTTPIIIVAFQTQQIFCVRDKDGAIKEGGEDTIQSVYYAWAMQQMDVEELGEGALYPQWRLREYQKFGVQALI